MANIPKRQATAYCKDNRLCVVGVHESELGHVPFGTSVSIDGQVPDGPVDLSKELSPLVKRALSKVDRPIASQVETTMMQMGAEDLVIRSRAGDQVATAQIQVIGQNAKKKVPRAVKSSRMIADYIKANPVDGPFVITNTVLPTDSRKEKRVRAKFVNIAGSEDLEEYGASVVSLLPAVGWFGVVALANGPSLVKSGRARAIACSFANREEKHAFCFGRKYCSEPDFLAVAHPPLRHALDLGIKFGWAQKIQQVRLPNSKISDFDPAAGWELGE
jgi:uncharacterized protein with GYD domain